MKYEHKKSDKIEFQDIPCQNCGTIITVPNPFYGCAFCSKCMNPTAYTIMGKKIKRKDT